MTPSFTDFAPPLSEPTPLRRAITAAYRRPEAEALAPLLDATTLPAPLAAEVAETARRLIEALRAKRRDSGVEGLVRE